MADLDLLVRDARLRRSAQPVDIAVAGGRIVGLEARPGAAAKQTIDAGGNLVLPGFVDPHMHLDKSFLGGWVPPTSGTYADAEVTIREQKRKMTVEDTRRRAGRAIELAVAHGVTRIRTNVDVDTVGGLTGLHGVLAARKDYADLVDIQIVALAHGDLLDGGGEPLMMEAMKLGADVVGGSPRQEMDDVDSARHIDKVFEIAKQFGAPIDMHVDAACDAQLRGIHYLATKTIREGYQGRVAAGHVVALTYYNEYYAERVIRLIAKAGVHIVTCPATTMISAPMLDPEPRGRGITRVKQLLKAGASVAIGQDNIDDPYNAFGDADPLTNGFLTAYAALLSGDEDLESVVDMLTTNGGRVLGLSDVALAVGAPATFNVVNAPTVREMFRTRADRLHVVRAGRVVATTRTESRLIRAAAT